MKNKKNLLLFVLIITLSITLVACSSGESVYNENIADNPTWDQLHQYNLDQGDFIAMISDSSPANNSSSDGGMDPAAMLGMLTPELQAKVDAGEMTQERMDEIIAGVESGELGQADIMAIMN